MKLKQLAEKFKVKVRRCRYCNSEFIPNAPNQVICKGIDCQRKANREKQARFRNKNKSEAKNA